MRLNRIVTSLLVLFVLVVGVYFAFLGPSKRVKSQKALDLLIEGNYRSAESILDSLPSTYPIALYRGYLRQAQGRYAESDLLLRRAFGESREAAERGEILLAQAINAYATGRMQELANLVASAKHLTSLPEITAFEGIVHYTQSHYHQAAKCFAAYDPPSPTSWLSPLFEEQFPNSWIRIHNAHCLIETGDFNRAKEILDEERHSLSTQRHHLEDLCALFLGLTYLKESSQLPFEERESFHKLAHFYLLQSGDPCSFPLERNLVISEITREACVLSKWGLAFAGLLQQWKATDQLEEVSSHIAIALACEQGEELSRVIQKQFCGTPLHTLITEKLITSISKRLRAGEIEDLFGLWRTVEALAPSPVQLATRVASLTAEEMYHTIDRDSDALPRTRAYLRFWSHVENRPELRMELARGLMKHGQLFWKKEGQELKGTHLIDLALQVGDDPERKAFRREIEQFFSALYSFAESTNMVGRLSLIFDTFEHFHIDTSHLSSPALIANHLADAAYHFKAHNYDCAHTHANWVLKLAPKNVEALRLYGLSAYQLGAFSKAAIALQKVPNPDEITQKALMLSVAFSASESDSHLALIDRAEELEED